LKLHKRPEATTETELVKITVKTLNVERAEPFPHFMLVPWRWD